MTLPDGMQSKNTGVFPRTPFDSFAMSDGNDMTAQESLELLSGNQLFVVERSKTVPCNDGSIGGGEDARWSYIKLVFATTQQEAIREAMGATNYEKAKLTTHNSDTTGKEYHFAEHNNWYWCILPREANGFYDTSAGWCNAGEGHEIHADW